MREELAALEEKHRLAGLWDYQSVPAEGGTQHTAAIYSKVVMPLEPGTPPPTPDAGRSMSSLAACASSC